MNKFVVVLLMESGAAFVWKGNADDIEHAAGLAIAETSTFFYMDQVQETVSITPCTMYKSSAR